MQDVSAYGMESFYDCLKPLSDAKADTNTIKEIWLLPISTPEAGDILYLGARVLAGPTG